MSRIAIFAQALDGHIGVLGNHPLLWSIKGDLPRFKQITNDGTLIMGRHTFESLPGILPDRHHIVVTSGNSVIDKHGDNMMVCVARSLEEAFEIAEAIGNENQFVIGGGALLNEALPYCDHVYRTKVPDLNIVKNASYVDLPVAAPYWGLFDLISSEQFEDHVFEVYTNPNPTILTQE